MFVRYGSKVRLCYSPDVGEQLVNVNYQCHLFFMQPSINFDKILDISRVSHQVEKYQT